MTDSRHGAGYAACEAPGVQILRGSPTHTDPAEINPEYRPLIRIFSIQANNWYIRTNGSPFLNPLLDEGLTPCGS